METVCSIVLEILFPYSALHPIIFGTIENSTKPFQNIYCSQLNGKFHAFSIELDALLYCKITKLPTNMTSRHNSHFHFDLNFGIENKPGFFVLNIRINQRNIQTVRQLCLTFCFVHSDVSNIIEFHFVLSKKVLSPTNTSHLYTSCDLPVKNR